jgi:tetratricopeptide (TPR) repeat protein
MRKTTAAFASVLALGLATGAMSAMSLLGAAPAAAAEVSIKVGKPLKEAQDLAKAHNYKAALAKIQEVEAIEPRTPYENYVIDELKAAVYNGLQDFSKAAEAEEAALATGQVPESQATGKLKDIAQFYFAASNYPKFLDYAARYQKDAGTSPDMEMLMAQAYYNQHNFRQAADAARGAIKEADAKGMPVKEQWLQVVMSSEHELGDSAGEQAALEVLVQRYPKPEYWESLLIRAENNIRGDTTIELDIDRLMFTTGVMSKPDEYTDMAELALVANAPAEAKKVLSKGFQTKTLGTGAPKDKDRQQRLLNMATTKTDADTAAMAQNAAAAEASPTGEALASLGMDYWANGQADKAADAIQRGIKKGVKNRDEAMLNLGIVYATSGKRAPATDAFRALAPNTPAGQVGHLWLLYVNSR